MPTGVLGVPNRHKRLLPATRHLPSLPHPQVPHGAGALLGPPAGASCWLRSAKVSSHCSPQPSLRCLPFPALLPATGSCQTSPHGPLWFSHLHLRRASLAGSPSLLGTALEALTASGAGPSTQGPGLRLRPGQGPGRLLPTLPPPWAWLFRRPVLQGQQCLGVCLDRHGPLSRAAGWTVPTAPSPFPGLSCSKAQFWSPQRRASIHREQPGWVLSSLRRVGSRNTGFGYTHSLSTSLYRG